MKLHLYRFLLLIFAISTSPLWAQGGNPLDCLKAQEVFIPLDGNDFSKSEILVEGRRTNAVYYEYQDKYTFWYKFIFSENSTLRFSVSPSREGDRYGINVYRYGSNDFCEKLVNGNLEIEEVERSAIFGKSKKLQYVYSLTGAKADTFYISVLSLTPADCGHFLRLETEETNLSIHAIHRPCYDFGSLEIPDFSQAKIQVQDVSLFIEGLSKAENAAEVMKPALETPAKQQGFGGLSTVVIESAEDDFISVGDRLLLNEVYFYTNTFAFKPEADSELKQLLNFLESNPSVSIEIQGHTANNTENIKPDPNFKGQGKAWNFKGNSLQLSDERANAVMDYLIVNGINKKRLRAVGYGDTQKRVDDAATFEEAEKNMRVEVLITGK